MIFLFFTTSQKKELRKSFRPFFGPFWQIFDKNSAANLLGRTYFLPAPFELCGRKFGQLATLTAIPSLLSCLRSPFTAVLQWLLFCHHIPFLAAVLLFMKPCQGYNFITGCSKSVLL
jgi:hypothetical protein